jgi:asparagine synthase (glutamine-hydrolysing)
MRGLCGWFSQHPVDDGAGQLRRMLAASHSTTPDAAVLTQPQAGLAVFGDAARPILLEVDGFFLAVVGHPRLSGGGRRSADPALLLRALREHGKDALARIGGDFALAVWDGRRRRGLLAVDRIGVHPLVYGGANGTLAFASSLDMLCGFPGMRRELSQQGVFDYVFHHVSPGPRTIFSGLLRVPPGHCIEVDAKGAGAPRPYWTMRFDEQPGRPHDELRVEFLALMQDCVAEAAEGATTGAFLSGGTDSSTVSGMLARVGPDPARTFSIGFDVAGYDEMEYARIAARHYACEHHEYYVTPNDVVDAVPRIAASYDQPFGNASAVPTYYCAKLARDHGMARLLAGDGGDELFGGNERYAKHHLLGLYQRVPAPLRRFVVEPLMLATPGLQHVPVLRKLRSYVQQARPAMPVRYATPSQLTHLGNANVFTPEFLAAVDPGHPQKLLDEAHAPYAQDSLINQMLGIDLRFILADGDLPKVTHMCELAGVDVAFPLLDDRLVAFSQSLASDLKLRGTSLRWFFKQALSDFLPPAVITKHKHGFGLPVGDWLVGHKPLLDLAADSIGLLRHRGIVQTRFIDELMGPRLREHPAYFGSMIWVLMMLGLWLDSRKL